MCLHAGKLPATSLWASGLWLDSFQNSIFRHSSSLPLGFEPDARLIRIDLIRSKSILTCFTVRANLSTRPATGKLIKGLGTCPRIAARDYIIPAGKLMCTPPESYGQHPQPATPIQSGKSGPGGRHQRTTRCPACPEPNPSSHLRVRLTHSPTAPCLSSSRRHCMSGPRESSVKYRVSASMAGSSPYIEPPMP